MKNIAITLIISFLAINLIAEESKEAVKAKKAFSRYMEYAHPSPVKVKNKEELPDYLFDNNSKRFLDKMLTVNEENETQKMQNESSIAVNPTNPKNLIGSAVDYRANSSTWVYVSHDGGETWENLNLGKPFPHWRSTNDPSVAFNADGVAFLNYGGFQTEPDPDGNENGGNAVFIARSFDEGKTWEAHIPVIIHTALQTLDSNFEDKYYIEIDNSPQSPYFKDIYIPWKRVTARDSATQIVISKSTDNGSTWSEPLGISHRLPGSSEDTTFGQSFPLATTSAEGHLYVCWNHGIEHGIGFVKSTDGGTTFTEPRIIHRYNIFGETKLLAGQGYRHTVKGKVRAEAYPVMRCDYSDTDGRGNIYLCWAADNPPNIYFSRSEDEGETWTDPVIVHSELKNDQFWPWMDIDPFTGDVGIMYLDSRRDPENIMVDCYVSYSSDFGDTWVDRLASEMASDLRRNPFNGNSFAGDYSGMAFYNGIVYPSWVDMRNTQDDITDSDVFTSIVNINAPNPVDSLQAQVIAEDPETLVLKWEPPTERAFGQSLQADEFVHRLYRDGEFIAEVDGNTSEFTDTGLTPYTEYEYLVDVHTAKDSSIDVTYMASAGGAAKPASPEIVDLITEYENPSQFKAVFKLPTKRADGTTDLVGLEKLIIKALYNGKAVYERSFEYSDIDKGTEIDLTDIIYNDISQSGYYTISAQVQSTHYSVTTLSDPVYSDVYLGPETSELTDFFDDEELNRYLIKGNWTRNEEFAYSGDFALSQNQYNDYPAKHIDTLTVFPVYINNDEYAELSFYHAAIIHPVNVALIEYSYDESNWKEVANFRRFFYPNWDDGELKSDDWKFEQFKIPVPENGGEKNRLQVRFIIKLNDTRDKNAWYIDNLTINSIPVSVENRVESNVNIFPNPTSNVINISSPERVITSYEVVDVYGKSLISQQNTEQSQTCVIDVTQLAGGSYFLKYVVNGMVHVEKFIVLH